MSAPHIPSDSEAKAEGFPADIMQAANDCVAELRWNEDWPEVIAKALKTERMLHYDARWANKAVDDVKAEFAGALWDIRSERQRQVDEEGFKPKHDDRHDDGALSQAAAAYAIAGIDGLQSRAEKLFPWEDNWWKPTDRRRDLVKAGALIVAEIERLDRAAQSHFPSDIEAEMKRRAEMGP